MIIVSAAAFFRRQSAGLVPFLVFSICFSPCFLNINNRFGFSENKAAAEPAAGARIAVRTALLKKVENFRTLMYHIIKIVGLYAPGSPRLLTLSKGGRNTEYGVFGRFTLKMKRKHILGVLCVVLASACYGITPILSNAALNGGLPASREMTNECVVLYSMGIASLLSLFNCLIGKKRLDVSGKQLVQLAAFGGGALAGTLLLITYAYLRIPAGMTIVLNFTYPVFVMLITLVSKKERITAVKFISPLLALAGIALISNASFSGSVNVGGVLIALLSGVVYAVYFIAGRESAYASLETPVSNFYITASACLWSLAAALILGRFCLTADSVMWIILFFEAFLGYVVGLRLLLAGIKLLGSVSASALNTLEPAFASLTSMAVFGEAMGLLKGCGVILVLAAAVIGILTLNREDSKTRSKA